MSDGEPGIELAHFRLHRGCGVRVHCRTCAAARDYRLEDVIARLKARGVGGERTGIKAAARFIEKPCPKCGGFKFETSPAFGAFGPGR